MAHCSTIRPSRGARGVQLGAEQVAQGVHRLHSHWYRTGLTKITEAERNAWFMRNFSFFDAPAVAFFTLPTGFGLREACDLGMFAQTVMLGLTAHGLGSCPQTALAFLANVIRPTLGLGDHEQLMFGMSFGYPTDAAVNEVRTDRAALEDVVTFHS